MCFIKPNLEGKEREEKEDVQSTAHLFIRMRGIKSKLVLQSSNSINVFFEHPNISRPQSRNINILQEKPMHQGWAFVVTGYIHLNSATPSSCK